MQPVIRFRAHTMLRELTIAAEIGVAVVISARAIQLELREWFGRREHRRRIARTIDG